MSGRPSPSTSPSATPPPCARWRFQRALSSVTVLVKRMPVREGGTTVNPGPPLAGTSSARQRYPASSCQTAGGDPRQAANARPTAKKGALNVSGAGCRSLAPLVDPQGVKSAVRAADRSGLHLHGGHATDARDRGRNRGRTDGDAFYFRGVASDHAQAIGVGHDRHGGVAARPYHSPCDQRV